jgi:hypothetical protein
MFSAPLENFQGAHWFALCTLVSTFRMNSITMQQNYAGDKQKSDKIMRTNMFAGGQGEV